MGTPNESPAGSPSRATRLVAPSEPLRPAFASMAALEAELWKLAGGRLAAEDVETVLESASEKAAEVLHLAAEDIEAPVADLFANPTNDDLPTLLSEEAWMAFVEALLAWAGGPGAIAERPRTPGAIRAWAAPRGVIERLDDPLAAVTGLVEAYMSHAYVEQLRQVTVRDVFERSFEPPRSASGPKVAELRRAAWTYLEHHAEREALRRRRERLWSTPVAGPLAGLSRRVRALHAELEEVEPGPVEESEEVEASVDAQNLRFVLAVRDETGLREAEVWISLVERRGDAARSSLDDVRHVFRHKQNLRRATERLLDAVHDASDRLQPPLRRALSAPRWHRLIRELEGTVRRHAPSESEAVQEERVAFRIEEDDTGRPVVEAVVQRRQKRGWSRGKRIDASRLADRVEDPRDRRVVDALTSARNGSAHRQVGAALGALVGHPRVFAGSSKRPLRVREATIELTFEARHENLWATFLVGDRRLECHALLEAKAPPQHLVFLEDDTVDVAVLPEMVEDLATAFARYDTGLPPDADDALLEILRHLPDDVGLELPPRLRGEARPTDPRPVFRLEPLPGGGLRVESRVRPLPGGALQFVGAGPRHVVGVDGPGVRVHGTRDFVEERRALERAQSAFGLDAGVSDGPRAVRLDDPETALELVRGLQTHPELATATWPEEATPWRVLGEAGIADLKVRTKRLADWFELRGGIEADEGRVSLAQLILALRKGRRFVEIKRGRFLRLEKSLLDALEKTQDVVTEQPDGEVGVGLSAVEALDAILPEEVLDPDPDYAKLRERLRQSANLEVATPEGLHAELRPYQTEGVEWLLRVASWAEGACLADDMGLGKTLQALGLAIDRMAEGPTLVVAPTSLGDNWLREAAKFAPDLKTTLHRGPDRSRNFETPPGQGDLWVTSYELLTRDIETFQELPFGTVIFDEAHALKNPDTRRAKAARQLDAKFRLGLTGTPLENHLGELWSLFRVLVPGLLGPREHFRERFVVPIERLRDDERREALRRLLRPFLLRRTKSQVAPDLPPRVEVTRPVELSEEELALYEAERRQALEELAKTKGDNRQRFAVLAALTRMRRLACHPALVHPESRVKSSKLQELLELADDLVSEGRRTLVFSQFTSHLALVREALDARGYGMLYLDGGTPAGERGDLVERWQAGREPFFLISLKAGGTGLNLTAADTVIHLDPWWNPAAEDQASDRTHRIGQDKPVTVIRLVSQGTIEETVLELHGDKRALAKGLLEGAETNARLGASQLLDLLKG
jgi:superfamily II DNA or RNA helicase